MAEMAQLQESSVAGEGAVRLHDHLLDLPEEILTRVLLALPDAAALCRAAPVCRSLATMASQDRLWIERLRRDLGVVDTMHPDKAGRGASIAFPHWTPCHGGA